MSVTSKQLFALNELFSAYPLDQFITQYLHRLPFALPNAAQPLCVWGSWEVLAKMLETAGVNVLLTRSNEQYTGETPTNSESARALSQEGYTLLIRHAERHHEGIARFAEQFAETFQGPINAHIYATPPGHFGFSWHYDAEDVFILQLAGEKEYQLRKNTVNPWPLEETLPDDMQYERELMPLMRVKLRAGDMLYIPCGYWHRGVAGKCHETAISLAIGVMSRTALDVFDLLRPQLLESLLWRQRLPIVSETESGRSQCESAYQELLELLANDLCKFMTSSQFRRKIIVCPKSMRRDASVTVD